MGEETVSIVSNGFDYAIEQLISTNEIAAVGYNEALLLCKKAEDWIRLNHPEVQCKTDVMFNDLKTYLETLDEDFYGIDDSYSWIANYLFD